MHYHFYSNETLLFRLDNAQEYDTATPYRYAVSRFVDLAQRIKAGQHITVQDKETTAIPLHTVSELMNWISVNFAGFENYLT
jgi:hypothetical protein